jgi:hypothetical protein
LGKLQDVIDIENDLIGIGGSWVSGVHDASFPVSLSAVYERPGTDRTLKVYSYADGPPDLVLLRFRAGLATSGLWKAAGWSFTQYVIDHGWLLVLRYPPAVDELHVESWCYTASTAR